MKEYSQPKNALKHLISVSSRRNIIHAYIYISNRIGVNTVLIFPISKEQSE